MPITDTSTEYIHPVLSRLTSSSYSPGNVGLRLPGGEDHIIGGTWTKYPNGTRYIRFVPQRGTENLTTTEPASPIVTAPSQTPMPAQKGLKLGALSGAALSVSLVVMVAEMIQAHGEAVGMLELRKLQDLEMIGIILTEPEAAISGIRNGVGTGTQDRTRENGGKRIRIHGYSRKAS